MLLVLLIFLAIPPTLVHTGTPGGSATAMERLRFHLSTFIITLTRRVFAGVLSWRLATFLEGVSLDVA